MPNAVYKLEPVLDNPLYEGFGVVTFPPPNFDPIDISLRGRKWTAPRLGPTWTPLPVLGRVRPFNDYPCIMLSIPAFSRRAVDVLRDMLECNGELLPLVSSIGEYYAFNVMTVADILDAENSIVYWIDDKRICAFDIHRYEFNALDVERLSIFRLVESVADTFVTDTFVRRVTDAGLAGFNFTKVWPLPPGVSWLEEKKRNWREKQRLRSKDGSKEIKGNSLVIELPLEKAKAAKAEKEHIAMIEDALDALLVDPQQGAPYFGSLEGDDYVKSACRLFLSCPDVDLLVERLRPFLRSLSWPRPIRVVKRFGEYVDRDAREVDVQV